MRARPRIHTNSRKQWFLLGSPKTLPKIEPAQNLQTHCVFHVFGQIGPTSGTKSPASPASPALSASMPAMDPPHHRHYPLQCHGCGHRGYAPLCKNAPKHAFPARSEVSTRSELGVSRNRPGVEPQSTGVGRRQGAALINLETEGLGGKHGLACPAPRFLGLRPTAGRRERRSFHPRTPRQGPKPRKNHLFLTSRIS